jgi:hypothetical protein
LLSAAALDPRVANADIIYTWNQDDGGTILTASFSVSSAAQAAGRFDESDVTSFNFTTATDTWTLTHTQISATISTIDASPTVPAISDIQLANIVADNGTDQINIVFDINYNISGGDNFEISSDSNARGYPLAGDGHWTISGATATATPEPSTALVAAFGAVAFAAYGWSRHRRAQRRQAAA